MTAHLACLQISKCRAPTVARVDGRIDLDAQQLVAGMRISSHGHTRHDALGDAEGIPAQWIASHQDGILREPAKHDDGGDEDEVEDKDEDEDEDEGEGQGEGDSCWLPSAGMVLPLHPHGCYMLSVAWNGSTLQATMSTRQSQQFYCGLLDGRQ